jgi:hypothetical protein
MIHLKTFEKNYTIELVQRLFRGLYAKGVQSHTTDNINAKDVVIRCGKKLCRGNNSLTVPPAISQGNTRNSQQLMAGADLEFRMANGALRSQ